MNRSILIVICDFLLVSLLAFSTVDINKVAQTSAPRALKMEINTNQAPDTSNKDLAAVMRLALDEERKNRDQLVGELVRSHFDIAPYAEASVELDPRRMTPDHVMALRDAGLNRVSLGIQDFDPQVQAAINRIQPFEQTEEVVRWIRDAGFQSLSLDLIYGLPFQTVKSFQLTLDLVLKLNPDRLAVFSYAHVPWLKPAQRASTSQRGASIRRARSSPSWHRTRRVARCARRTWTRACALRSRTRRC